MTTTTAPPVDDRDADAILAQFQLRRFGHVPQWNPPEKTAGAALGQIFSRFVEAILQRLNQVPAKNKLAFLDLLGLRLIPAQAARAPIVFELSKDASDSSAPAGTQVAAPPPPGSAQQVVFETEQDIGVAAAKLTEVFSLWPGRDEYIDHSAAYLTRQPITLFQASELEQTEHILYLGDSTLLSFAGATHLQVEFDLAQGSSAPLEITWEYWDGKVWRGFKTFKPSCLEAAERGHDGTAGLTRPGSVGLDTDCAETALTTVNGIKSYWIRGRLTQALPPDPELFLPVVESVRLKTLIDQGLTWNLDASIRITRATGTGSDIEVTLLDNAGGPLSSVPVFLTFDDPSISLPLSGVTSAGVFKFSFSQQLPAGVAFKINFRANSVDAVFSGTFPDPADNNLHIDLTLGTLNGLPPDKAISDGKALDVTKAFLPLGQGLPGSALYFKLDQIFTKPGASVELFIQGAAAPTGALLHVVNWEYWNGERWTLLLSQSTSSPADFTGAGVVAFTVPNDMVPVKVNNEDGLWIRVRLVSGGYGFKQEIKLPGGSNPEKLAFDVPQPPVVSLFLFGYSWPKGPDYLEQVLTFNDFQYQDHADDARWPGRTFSPFEQINEVTPAMYLGFDQPLPVNNFGIYLDIVEQSGEIAGPPLVWEYFNGAGWRELIVNDETQRLRMPGIISFIPEDDSVALVRFDKELHWLRGRLKEDGPPGETRIIDIFPNAVWASQRRTFTNLPLGASTGMPDQIFQFTQIPVLAGQEIQVQELGGARANTEWRILALQVASGDPNIVKELEAELAEEGTQTEIVLGDLRLVRDKTKRVIQAWVRWKEVPNFFDSGPNDRYYVLDHASGLLLFGNGDSGMVPPPGDAIVATSFRSGGGLAGNVPAKAITQLLGSVSGIQSITNPRAAEGGANGETIEQFAGRAPSSIRHRGRAVTLKDYETMAHEASAGIAVARAIPTHNPAGVTLPGWIKVLIIPQSKEPRPVPSFGLREEVRGYLEKYAPADIAGAHRINITGPDYLAIDVDATLAPKDLKRAGTVEQKAREALAEFLHPLRGGPEGSGWELGRGVYLSDIARSLGETEGVDFVEEIALSVGGVLQGDHVDVPVDRIVVAGQIRLNLIESI